MSSPSQDLAQRIVDKLIAENLVLVADAKTAQAKIADGKMFAEDWRLAIEKAIDKGAQA